MTRPILIVGGLIYAAAGVFRLAMLGGLRFVEPERAGHLLGRRHLLRRGIASLRRRGHGPARRIREQEIAPIG